MKKHIISLFALTTVFLAATTTSCTDEILPGTVTYTGAFTPKGQIVDAYLTLNVAELSIKATTRAVADDSEDERRITDIWVFQYDYNHPDRLINEPYYRKIETQEELADLTDIVEDGYIIKASDNDGDPSILYVVANTHDKDWVQYDESTEGYPGFNSLTDLKKQAIPNPDPIRVGDADSEDELSIPMGGSWGEEKASVIYSGYRIQVDVARMFAKLYVTINLQPGEDIEDAEMDKLMIEHISRSCTVATVFNGDGSWYYPEGMGDNFEVSRTFFPTASTKVGTKTRSYGPFVLYVPENYQQEAEDSVNAMKLTPYLRLTVGYGSGGEINGYEGFATITPNPSYTAYPGSWETTTSGNINWNVTHGESYKIERNNIYDITLTIVAHDDLTASANSFIAPLNTTVAFYPYYRDEEMSPELIAAAEENTDLKTRYDFTTYLNSSYTEGDLTKKIKSVKIIWQTDDCIGDNSEGDLVWIDDEPDSEISDDEKSIQEIHRKIYVKVNKAGNALIGAYDASGTILWSWHIWAPNEGVDPEGSAIEYRHISWDSNGINAGSYEEGRLVMNLNLGALSETPDQTVNQDTYGMLYQWGRKDPFLPMKVTPTNGLAGMKGGHDFYNYSDYTTTNGGNSRDYVVTIDAHDNANILHYMTGYDGSMATSSDLFNTDAATVKGLNGTFGTSDNEVILNSVRHPTTFIAASPQYNSTSGDGSTADIDTYYNEGDWLPVNDDFLWGGGEPDLVKGELHVYTQAAEGALVSGYSIDAYLENDYGPNKTIFDPCPYGWRVSPGDIWLGFTKDGLNWEPGTGNAAEGWSDINVVETETPLIVAQQCGYTMYMEGWKTGRTSYFPIQGTRISSGQPYNIGPRCGNYHNATVDRPMTKSTWNEGTSYIRRVDILHFHSENSSDANWATQGIDGGYAFIRPFTIETHYYDKSVAGPLRCVRDTK